MTHIYHSGWRNRRNETKLNQKWSRKVLADGSEMFLSDLIG